MVRNASGFCRGMVNLYFWILAGEGQTSLSDFCQVFQLWDNCPIFALIVEPLSSHFTFLLQLHTFFLLSEPDMLEPFPQQERIELTEHFLVDLIYVKLPKCEMFDCRDFQDFYTIKFSWVGDF
jgi:hypothetical protein